MAVTRISDAEWRVMKVLWQKAPRSANDIIDALAETDWSAATIRTLVGRLVKKGAVTFEKAGREYLYSPAVSEAECKRQARRSFIRRVYDGSAQPMLAHLLAEEDLTPEELDELRCILDEKQRRLQ